MFKQSTPRWKLLPGGREKVTHTELKGPRHFLFASELCEHRWISSFKLTYRHRPLGSSCRPYRIALWESSVSTWTLTLNELPAICALSLRIVGNRRGGVLCLTIRSPGYSSLWSHSSLLSKCILGAAAASGRYGDASSWIYGEYKYNTMWHEDTLEHEGEGRRGKEMRD